MEIDCCLGNYIEENDRAHVSPAYDLIPMPSHRQPNYKENHI